MSAVAAQSEGRATLTAEEAAVRAAHLDVHRVQVDLDLREPAAEVFRSTCVVEFASSAPRSWVDFDGRALVSATLNGEPLDLSGWQRGRIALTNLQSENVLVVEGEMAYSADGEGLHRHVDPEDGRTYLYAMSFLDAAPRWFACFDQPDLKAMIGLRVQVPPEWVVLGNGPSRRSEASAWEITSMAPLSTYLVTLVAGPYASVLAEHDGIRLGFHVRQSLGDQLREQAADLLTVTGEAFDYYHQTFAVRYPFGEYHQAFVPDFNAGAMENPGCVTLRDTLIFRGRATEAERGRRAGVVAHELAHMWFGDLVTMRWWDDLWLNESFAEYLAQRCCTAATQYSMWTDFGIVRKDWGMVADQSPSTHPVAGNGAATAAAALQDFDGISYAKGAAVLKQLATYLGEAVFLAGLRRYIRRFQFGNARLQDLLDCWVEAGARDLDAWAESWLRSSGIDLIDVEEIGDATRAVIRVPPPDAPQRVHALTVAAVSPTGALAPIGDVRLGAEPVAVRLPAGAELLIPDATDATWAKIRFGPDGWALIAEALPELRGEPALVVIYNAVRDAVRDGELAPEVALGLIERGLPGASSETLVASLLNFAADQLCGAYAAEQQRSTRIERLHGLAWQLLARSESGSDRQLTAFRTAVRTAHDDWLLRRWGAGERLPTGISLDPELGWRIVQRRAALGAAPQCIDAALSYDPSASGQLHAWRARAGRPDEAAKVTAWQAIMGRSQLSAYEVYAVCDGFFDPEQLALTRPYATRYYEQISATAQFRSGWVLAEVARKAYPWSVSEPAALEAAESLLQRSRPGPVRRAVVDGTDKLRRAVLSVQRFASLGADGVEQ